MQFCGMPKSHHLKTIQLALQPIIRHCRKGDQIARTEVETRHIGLVHQDYHPPALNPTETIVFGVDRRVELTVCADGHQAEDVFALRSRREAFGTVKFALPLGVFHLRSRAPSGRGNPPGVKRRLLKSLN